jgi:subtilisin family serine protease
VRAFSIVGIAALVTGLLSVPLGAQAATSPTVPSISQSAKDAAKYPAGTYIVTLAGSPAATYKGGVAGLARTQVSGGKQLDATAVPVKKYTSYLRTQQSSLARAVGAKVLYNYTAAYNGFAAKLTSTQAARLAKSSSVLSVIPSERLQLQESHSLEFLDVSTAGGTWEQVGGVEDAGAGVVVGIIDSGIAPENPSFAGGALGTDATTGEPYLVGDTITFEKGDGGTFTSTTIGDADGWSNSDYSEKLVGAKYYVEGFGLDQIGDQTVGEYVSPRDGSGHGSHTASTAAGNHDIATTVEGIDFGTISGVAPAAKIAAYKACWTGPDGIEASPDDGCDTIDLLAAINQAVLDGVDVINYSIGGGSASSTFSPTDAAFLNASAAGVFVAASAGNDGPDPSTLDNAAPWETTVAASTIPDYEGTIELGDGAQYVGAGISLLAATSSDLVSRDLVLASDHPAAGATAEDANLCLLGSLGDVTGKIVVCDRGNNARVEKSEVVAEAGGVGMILVNVPGGADDVDNDFHSVPTVHTYAAYHDEIHAYAATEGATATLITGNVTPDETPVPQIAGFSSHGPVLAAGSDVIKPDVAAPGVSILAAYANAPGADPEFAFLSGTSMASPHVAGLAAVYLGAHPNASPAEIHSALMTTATNLVDADGEDVTDPFTQGAGQVVPADYLDAGLYYPADIDDWKSYLVGTDQALDYSPYVAPIDFEGVEPIDASDLNQASIAIGDLIGEQTVTRTVTALAAGEYEAAIDVPGIEATVTPSTLDLAAGESGDFTVTFAADGAPADAWATGFLTWASADHVARSDIAIHPTSALAPAAVEADVATTDSTEVAFTAGVTGSLGFSIAGFTRGDVTPNAEDPTLPYTGIALATGDSDSDYADAFHVIGEGVDAVQFDVYPTVEDGVTDLDLFIIYCADEALTDCDLVAQSATGAAAESVTITEPAPGTYISETSFFATPEDGVPYIDVAYAYDTDSEEGDAVVESPVAVTVGDESTTTVEWWGLKANSLYRGFLSYGDTDIQTVLDLTTGDSVAPTNSAAPSFTGAGTVGSTLTADPGTWSEADEHMSYSYQWTAGTVPIAGATSPTFVVPDTLLGATIGLVVTGRIGPDPDAAGTAATATTTVIVVGTTTVVPTSLPTVTGDAVIGKTLTAVSGTWNVPNPTLSYQWVADGVPVAGATASTLKLGPSLQGKRVAVAVTATVGEAQGTATSAAQLVKARALTKISIADSTITTKQKAKITVTVKASRSAKETGTVVLHYGSRTKKETLHVRDKGKVTFTLPKLKRGTYSVWAEYRGSSTVAGDDSIKKKLKVRAV